MQRAVELVHEQLLAGLNPELFADGFWDHDLEFRGDFDPYLLHILRTPNNGIDRQLVCQHWHRWETRRAGREHVQNGTEFMSVSSSSDRQNSCRTRAHSATQSRIIAMDKLSARQ